MRFPTSGFFYELVYTGLWVSNSCPSPDLSWCPPLVQMYSLTWVHGHPWSRCTHWPGPDVLIDLRSCPPLVQMYSLTWVHSHPQSRCTHWPEFMPTPGPDVLTDLSSCPPLVQMYSLTWVHAHPWSRCTHRPEFMPNPCPDVLTDLSSCPPLVQLYSLAWVHAHLWSSCTHWPEFMAAPGPDVLCGCRPAQVRYKAAQDYPPSLHHLPSLLFQACVAYTHRLNMELDLQSLFKLHVQWCTAVLFLVFQGLSVHKIFW